MSAAKTSQSTTTEHPIAPYLRMDRIPHIWCPTCGIGTVVKCFASALEGTAVDLDKAAIVSGIGCTGRVAGYMKLDAFHSTHGRAIPFATGLKLARPELLVTVFSGDGDLTGIGGNHFIHAARRNMDVLVVLVNNRNLPDFVDAEYQEEILGLSDAAVDLYPEFGPRYHRILNYHAAHDIGHWVHDKPVIGCTAFAVAGDSLLVGRNFDFEAGRVFDDNKIIGCYRPARGHAFLSVAWPGMAGVVTGLNSQRLR